jgi:hypothetical protein
VGKLGRLGQFSVRHFELRDVGVERDVGIFRHVGIEHRERIQHCLGRKRDVGIKRYVGIISHVGIERLGRGELSSAGVPPASRM